MDKANIGKMGMFVSCALPEGRIFNRTVTPGGGVTSIH